MPTRRWTIAAMATGAIAALARLSGEMPSPAAVPRLTASPRAATPRAEAPPLYTPIPPSEARNVVGRVTIELTDRGFIPSRFENAINQDIHVTLVNTGTRRHTFTIDELGVAVAVDPGEQKMLTIPSPRRLGHYTYYSDTPEDRELGMRGIMTIFI
jgi:plastocyanin